MKNELYIHAVYKAILFRLFVIINNALRTKESFAFAALFKIYKNRFAYRALLVELGRKVFWWLVWDKADAKNKANFFCIRKIYVQL